MRRELVMVAVAALAGAALTVVLRIGHVGVPLWYFVALAPLAVVLVIGVRTMLSSHPGLHPEPVPAHGPAPDPRLPLEVLVPLEQRINAALSDRRRFAGDLRPVLAELAATPWTEEEAQWLEAGRPTPPLTTERLRQLLDAIERPR